MSIINFTVSGGLYGSDVYDVIGDVRRTPLTGKVKFAPEFPLKRPAALAPSHNPPAALVPREFDYVIDVDGLLKPSRGSSADGVRLWANDPVFRLYSLVYRISFDVTDLAGNPVEVQGGTFYAPTTDKVMYLTSLLGIPGVKGVNGLDRWIDGGTPLSTSAESADGGGI